jgi:hypothetical protein
VGRGRGLGPETWRGRTQTLPSRNPSLRCLHQPALAPADSVLRPDPTCGRVRSRLRPPRPRTCASPPSESSVTQLQSGATLQSRWKPNALRSPPQSGQQAQLLRHLGAEGAAPAPASSEGRWGGTSRPQCVPHSPSPAWSGQPKVFVWRGGGGGGGWA